jgi:hypothetical protein
VARRHRSLSLLVLRRLALVEGTDDLARR